MLTLAHAREWNYLCLHYTLEEQRKANLSIGLI